MSEYTAYIKTYLEKRADEKGNVIIPLEKNKGKGCFTATVSNDGVHVSNLHLKPFLPWDVFEKTITLLNKLGGKAAKGDAMKGKLGDSRLPIDSVEGYIAYKVYNQKLGASVFRRITPISCILVFTGLCKTESGYLSLTDFIVKEPLILPWKTEDKLPKLKFDKEESRHYCTVMVDDWKIEVDVIHEFEEEKELYINSTWLDNANECFRCFLKHQKAIEKLCAEIMAQIENENDYGSPAWGDLYSSSINMILPNLIIHEINICAYELRFFTVVFGAKGMYDNREYCIELTWNKEDQIELMEFG